MCRLIFQEVRKKIRNLRICDTEPLKEKETCVFVFYFSIQQTLKNTIESVLSGSGNPVLNSLLSKSRNFFSIVVVIFTFIKRS